MREYTQYTAQMTKTHSHIRTTTNYVYISAKRSRMEPKRQQQGEMTHEKKNTIERNMYNNTGTGGYACLS